MTRWYGRSRCLHLLLLVCMLACCPRLASSDQTPTCQENEVLVDITVTHKPLDNLEFLDVFIEGPRFRQEGSNSNSSSSSSNGEGFYFYQRLLESESTNDVPVQVSVCVPADQCLMVMLQVNAVPPPDSSSQRYALPVNEVSISYDGQEVSNLRGSLPYQENGVMIAGELGDCEITCDFGEALVEIEAATGASADYDWQLFDDLTGQMIAHCPPSFFTNETGGTCYWTLNRYYSDRFCVVRDGCYTLVIGQKNLDYIVSPTNAMTVTFDGTPLASFENMPYVRVQVNDGSTECESLVCDSESRPVEIFVFPEYLRTVYENITWSVYSVEGVEANNPLLASNTVTFGDRAFYYNQTCIPNTTYCIQLKLLLLSGPSMLVTESTLNVTYHVVLDGIKYASNDLEITLAPSLAAGNCSNSQLCATKFVPVQVDLTTGPSWTLADFPFEISFSSDGGITSLNQNYQSILPGEQYRFFPCLQTSLLWQDQPGSCTAFYVDAEQFADGTADYDISVNGDTFSEQYVPQKAPYYGDKVATPLAGPCEVLSSANGSPAGIMGVLSLLLLVLVA